MALPTDIAAAAAAAREALSHEPAGLVTDVDGTLSPIVAIPADARLVYGAREELARLHRRLAVVALVSGRAARDVRSLVGVDTLLVVGNHGVEWLEPGRTDPQIPPQLADVPRLLRDALARVRAQLARDDGIVFEEKGVSATIHYRLAPDPLRAHRDILAAVERAGAHERFDVREGRMSIELRPRNAGDKGTAVRAIVERYALRGLVVFGDDRTDLDAFRVAADLRASGRLKALIGAVGRGEETPSEVRSAADVVLESPAVLVELLRRLA